jgi:hypothetical protein
VPDQGYKSPTAFRLRTTLLSALRPCPRGYAADHDAAYAPGVLHRQRRLD